MEAPQDRTLGSLIDLAPLVGLAAGTGLGLYQETIGRKRPTTWSRAKKGLLFLDDPIRHFLHERPPKITGLDRAKNVALAANTGLGFGYIPSALEVGAGALAPSVQEKASRVHMPVSMVNQVRYHATKLSARRFRPDLQHLLRKTGLIQPQPMGLGKKLMIAGALGTGAAVAAPLGVGAYNIHEVYRFLDRLENNPQLIAAAHASDARFGSLKGLTNADKAQEATFTPSFLTDRSRVTTQIHPDETRTSFGDSFRPGGSRYIRGLDDPSLYGWEGLDE